MNLLRKIYVKIRGIKTYTIDDISLKIINDIVNGGGKVGSNVDIYFSDIDLLSPYLIDIGNNVTITGVKILTHDASLKKTIGYSKVGHVTIGNDVFIGWGSIILPNTTIGNKVVIGAGSVIAKDIPDNSVVVGNPPHIISSYDEYINKTKILMEEFPVIDLLPEEIKSNNDIIEKIKQKGFGYIK